MDGSPEETSPLAEEPSQGVSERAREMAQRAKGATLSFFPYVWRRFQADGCTGVAAGLSYTSLLAVVPLLAIGLAMFAAFPAFADLRDDLIIVLAQNLAPDLASVVNEYLGTFISNAGGTSAAGVIGIGVTAILLVNTIQTAFDKIWGVTNPRHKLKRLPVYWAIITLGPLLFGASLSISTYVFSLASRGEFYGLSAGLKIVTAILPFLLEIAGFALFYRLIPTRPVRFTDAGLGAIVAAALFELLKRGFGLYLQYFGSYQLVYGALATVPIFLIWMYLVWVTVLIGAEIAAALPEWRSGRRQVGDTLRRGDLLSLSLGAFAELAKAQAHGSGIRTEQLVHSLAADPGRLVWLLEALKTHRFIARADSGRWMLARDLGTFTIHDVCHHLGIALGETVEEVVPLVDPLMRRIAEAEKSALDETVGAALKSIGAI
ncbi:YihY family inner membrane protein [Dongia sp.]|uniref:YihY family inner membrane protein n=1 Tax=Dongia sp. TaxID=1977262 RepID=UPI0035B0FE20